MLARKVSFNFGSAVVLRLVTNAIGLLVVGIMTRRLGPADYGEYSTVFAFLFLFSVLADMGLGVLLTRDISQSEADAEKTVANYFGFRIFLTVLASVLAVVIVWLIPQYSAAIKFGVAIGCGYMIFSSFVQLLMGIFQKALKVYLVSFADIISRTLQLLIILFLLWTGRTEVLDFIYATVIAEIAHFIMVLFFARSLVRLRVSFDFGEFKKILKNALPVAVSLLFVILYFKMDTVMLSLMRPSADVGMYSVAYKVLEIVIFVPAILAGLLMPILSKEAVNISERFRRIMALSFDIMLALALPAAVVMIILAGPIIAVVGGAGFGQSVLILRVLAVAVILIFFGNLGGNALVALNLQNKSVWIYALGAVLNFVANLIFIPRYGALAAALNTVLTELVVTVGMFWLIHRAVGSTFSFQRTTRIGLATLVMGVVVFTLRQHTVFAFAAALSYLPILYAVRGFSVEEIKKLV